MNGIELHSSPTLIDDPTSIPVGHGTCPISSAICKLYHPLKINIPWTLELKQKRCSETLRGIELYHDFAWDAKFGHRKSVFKNCNSLARLLRSECPDGSIPALILTARADIPKRHSFDWNYRYVLAINIDAYRTNCSADPALTFFAADFPRLSRIANIEEKDINDWLALDPKRVERLRDLVEHVDRQKGIRTGTSEDLKRMFAALKEVDGETVDLTFAFLRESGLDSEFILSRLLFAQSIEDFPDILGWILNAENRHVLTQLQQLKGTSLDKLNGLGALTAIHNALAIWEQNSENAIEDFWQIEITQRPFILGQIFSFPVVLVRGKAYVGGKDIDNLGGSITDFLFKNEYTHNVLFVEIKTPESQLLSNSEYRSGVHSVSSELSGAIIQVATQRDTFLKDFGNKRSAYQYFAFQPHCVVVVGKTSQLDTEDKKKSFELFRGSLKGVEVITFDELFGRLRSIVQILDVEKSALSGPLAAAPMTDEG